LNANNNRTNAELMMELLKSDKDLNCHRTDIKAWLEELLLELENVKNFDFRKIGDHLYDGIYLSDGKGTTLYVNKAYTRITGIRPEEVVGKNVRELLDQGMYRNAVTPEVIRLKKQVNSMGIISRNGTRMLVTGNPILDENGDVEKVVVIDREMTDLLKIKAELEASQQKMKVVEEDTLKSKQEIEHLRKLHLNNELIGCSPQIEAVIQQIQQVADFDVTVLICGETGVGKEVISNEIHINSTRSKGPFIKVNCAAIPATLLEAELFGYEKGAYTGASNSKLGMFELADQGTILLDEIGDMPMELQSKLLRVIQHKEVMRIGGRKPIKLDVRILAATNCDLKELVEQGKFREDLFYRLNVFPIYVAPLRTRVDDITEITDHFLNIYNAKYGKAIVIDDAGLEVMKNYAWPGNIRELQNIVERLVIVSEPSAVIGSKLISRFLNIPVLSSRHIEEQGLKKTVEELERKIIEKAIKKYGSTRKAAQALKIDQSTIVKKAKRLGVIISDEKAHQ
jgi:PAS domain S-box-containing protein